MNKSKQFYNFLLGKMKEQRQIFLESVGVTEKEIKKQCRGVKNYRNREYFIIDECKIWMPRHFQFVQDFKHLLSTNKEL